MFVILYISIKKREDINKPQDTSKQKINLAKKYFPLISDNENEFDPRDYNKNGHKKPWWKRFLRRLGLHLLYLLLCCGICVIILILRYIVSR